MRPVQLILPGNGGSTSNHTGRALATIVRAALVPFVFAATLVLSGCGGLSRSDRPARVEERAARLLRPRLARPPLIRRLLPIRRRPDRRSPGHNRIAPWLCCCGAPRISNAAAISDAATVSWERALRISPDDALLWQRLAGVRMAQHRHELVLQLAAKSNALAKADERGLRSENWRLIAQSRRALGDEAGRGRRKDRGGIALVPGRGRASPRPTIADRRYAWRISSFLHNFSKTFNRQCCASSRTRDQGLILQYLAAVMGYMLGSQRGWPRRPQCPDG